MDALRRPPAPRAAFILLFVVTLGLAGPGPRDHALAQRDAGERPATSFERLTEATGRENGTGGVSPFARTDAAAGLVALADAAVITDVGPFRPEPPRAPPREDGERIIVAQATEAELRRRLAERDAVIDELLERVERLEGLLDAPPDPPAAGPPAEPPPPPPPAPPRPADSEPAAAQAAPGSVAPTPPPPAPPRPSAAEIGSSEAAPPPPAPPAAEAGPAQPPDAEAAPAQTAPSPGQFEVDPEAIDRALERALVRAGALLLPSGWLEIEPSVSYLRQENDDPLFLRLVSPDGTQFTTAGTREVRRNEVENSLTLRIGLPFDSQAEVEVPYGYESRSTIETVGSTRRKVSDDGWGLGDVNLGIAKTLLRESGWRPDLIARVQWDSDTGQTDDGIVLGSGFHELSGFLTAVKRQDPLVFVGSLGYETAFENDGVDPGGEFMASFGTVLAASPETSLRFFLQQSFINEAEVNGQDVPGTDGVEASFVVGVSSVVAPRTLLDVAAGIGVTDDGADYTLTVSLPIRFNLGGFLAGF